MKTVTLTDYRYQAAGRVWNIPRVRLLVLPDGSQAVSEAEIQRIQLAIGNEICGSDGPLTIEELDFLCDATDTSLAEVARLLDLHKSTLSKWRATGQISKAIYSVHLKKLFWFKLFGEHLGGDPVPVQLLADEQGFLRYAHERAIHEKLADSIELLAA